VYRVVVDNGAVIIELSLIAICINLLYILR
jgi:hypothetical protein